MEQKLHKLRCVDMLRNQLASYSVDTEKVTSLTGRFCGSTWGEAV